MSSFQKVDFIHLALMVAILVLTAISVVVIRFLAPSTFNTHIVYIVVALLLLYIFLKIDFEIFSAFSPYLYVLSILLLILPLVIGQVTRGAVRWIPIGNLTLQPSEIVRPFLLLFFANYIFSKSLTLPRLIKLSFLFFLPIALILIQPSLGVAVLTSVGFLGVLFASSFSKKYFLIGILLLIIMLPIVWLALAPYQKQRVKTFFDPETDPLGAGYNSIQSMIAVGSGKILGRGLGKGAQTQLAFLPERQTDFIFAAISEELGFFGSSMVLLALMVIFWSLIKVVGEARNPTARAFASGIVLVLFSQTFIHIGMNMGLLPITGVPLPFVSAGGSALIANTISIAIVMKAKK